MVNGVDLYHMLRSMASDLGLHCLLRPVCSDTSSKYDNLIKSNTSQTF